MSSAAHPVFSLLYPAGHSNKSKPGHHAPNEADLGLAPLIRALDPDSRGRHSRFIGGVLAELNTAPAVIGYRQDVLADLLATPALVTGLNEVQPHLAELSNNYVGRRWQESLPLHQIGARLAELDAYLNCVESLWAALERAGDKLQAAGWQELKSWLASIRQEPSYENLREEIPGLRAQLSQASSVTIGINLDAQLRPQSATLVSINKEAFTGKGTLLNRLLGDKTAQEMRGMTGLYKAGEAEGPARFPEHELFRELNAMLERIAQPVAKALERYRQLNSANLAALAPELTFYLGAVRLISRLQAAGLPLCRPQIAPPTEKAGLIEDVYNLELALRLLGSEDKKLDEAVVLNRVEFGPEGTLFVLTGPNSGGKTTYLRAIGQAQVMFQAGLLVPGRAARLSPADAIFTHFASAERVSAPGGRLEEELERLSRLFAQASPSSLVLLNEPLASTDYTSSRVLGRDLLAGLKLLGARAVYVTHLHELAAEVAGVVSLVAGLNFDDSKGRPTYTIRPGRPSALGYASELAERHGLNLAQIETTLRKRGFTDPA